MDSLSRAFSGPTSELLIEYFTTLNHLYARLHTFPDHHRLHHLTHGSQDSDEPSGHHWKHGSNREQHG
jgi:hypothetical protein